MSSITSSPVRAALPPQFEFASGPASARQPGQASEAGVAAEDGVPPMPIREEVERLILRANLTVELTRALSHAPYSLSQQSIDGLRSLGIPVDALLAENGNVWDEAGIRQLQSLLNPPPPPPPPYWEVDPERGPYPYPSPYPYPVDPTAPRGDSTRAKLTRPYV